MKYLIFLFVIFLTEQSLSYDDDINFERLNEEVIEDCRYISSDTHDDILDNISSLHSSNLPDVKGDIEDIVIDHYWNLEDVFDDYMEALEENDIFDKNADFYSFRDVRNQERKILEWNENIFRSCLGIDKPQLDIHRLMNTYIDSEEIEEEIEELEEFVSEEWEDFVEDEDYLFSEAQKELSKQIDQFKNQWKRLRHTITISPEDNYAAGVDTLWMTVDASFLGVVPTWKNYAFIEREGVRYIFPDCKGDDPESECGQIASQWKNTLESGESLEITFKYIRAMTHKALRDKNDRYMNIHLISSFR